MTPVPERKPLRLWLLRLAIAVALIVGLAVVTNHLVNPHASTTSASPPSASVSSVAQRPTGVAEQTGRKRHWATSAWSFPSSAAHLLEKHMRPTSVASMPVTIPYLPGVRGEESDRFSYGGVSYDDPTASGIPLQWVEGGEDTWLTPGFTLRDFAPRDGAAFARIDPAFVVALERLRIEADTISIVSGYRHPQHNAAVGGTGRSFHTAGRAADVWSPRHSPIDLARLALRAMGCDIGIGLGPHTIHLDLRGDLTTWTYPGASLHEAAFDAWALTQCGRPVPPSLALAAASTWLSDSTTLAGAAAVAPANTLSPDILVERYARTITEVARQGRLTEGAGGIIIDATMGAEPSIRYLRASSPEAVSLGLVPLISWSVARGDAYVAYLVVTSEGTTTGITNVASLRGIDRAAAPNEVLGAERSAPPSSPTIPSNSAAASPDASSRGMWTVVVASLASQDAARKRAMVLRDEIRHLGSVSVVAAPPLGRYRVTVGPYDSASEARQALNALDGTIVSDAWILAL